MKCRRGEASTSPRDHPGGRSACTSNAPADETSGTGTCCFGTAPAWRDAEAEKTAYEEAIKQMEKLALMQTDAQRPAKVPSEMKAAH